MVFPLEASLSFSFWGPPSDVLLAHEAEMVRLSAKAAEVLSSGDSRGSTDLCLCRRAQCSRRHSFPGVPVATAAGAARAA